MFQSIVWKQLLHLGRCTSPCRSHLSDHTEAFASGGLCLHGSSLRVGIPCVIDHGVNTALLTRASTSRVGASMESETTRHIYLEREKSEVATQKMSVAAYSFLPFFDATL